MVFKPGQSGNPGGKSKEKIWRDAIAAAIRQHTKIDDLKLAAKEIAISLVKEAEKGDIAALKEIGQRLDGNPDTGITVEHTGTVTQEHVGEFSLLRHLEEFERRRAEESANRLN